MPLTTHHTHRYVELRGEYEPSEDEAELAADEEAAEAEKARRRASVLEMEMVEKMMAESKKDEEARVEEMKLFDVVRRGHLDGYYAWSCL